MIYNVGNTACGNTAFSGHKAASRRVDPRVPNSSVTDPLHFTSLQ
jgi:hypothetical protein